MLDLLAIGDLMIDFTPAGISKKGNLLFERNPGGGPANAAVTVSRLGGEAGFIGTVGDDVFGRFLAKSMVNFGVDISGLKYTDKGGTKLGFVTLDEHNNRSFYFVPGPIAEIYFDESDIDINLINRCKIFLLSTVSQYREPIRTASAKILNIARQADKKVAYDPNWNIAFSTDKVMERSVIMDTILKADIVKLSEEEIQFVFGSKEYEKISKGIMEMGVKLLVITLGPRGCYYRYCKGDGYLPTFDVKVQDTTGSGDAFMGGLIYSLTRDDRKDIEHIPKEEMETILRFAHACGALCATKRGAMPSVNNKQEVYDCIKNTPILRL